MTTWIWILIVVVVIVLFSLLTGKKKPSVPAAKPTEPSDSQFPQNQPPTQ